MLLMAINVGRYVLSLSPFSMLRPPEKDYGCV